MIKEARQTVSWLWDVIYNPDVVSVDVETGEEIRESWKRSAQFHLLRPMWMRYFLTTNPGCGCRKRFGLWYTMWCGKHAGYILGKWPTGDNEEKEE